MGTNHSDHMHTDIPAADVAERHGMAVVGVDTIFLSHLPMFMRLHDYQVILEASFGTSDGTYRQDREANPSTKLYTFDPERFVLPELFPGNSGESPRLKAFVGSLVRNHFEQPAAHPEQPVEIASDVVVEIINVVHQHKFDPRAQRPEHLKYVLFGKGKERFLGHLISRPPDFDQLLSVDFAGQGFSDDQLRSGVEFTVTGRRDQPGDRVQEQETVTAVAHLDSQEVPVEINARAELYFETNDLKQAM